MATRFMVYDRWGDQAGAILCPLSAKRTREVSGTDTLELTCADALEKDQRIVLKDSMGRWCEFIVIDVQEARSDRAVATTAYCEGSIVELSRRFIEEREGRGYSPASALAKALEGTRWQVGSVDSASAQDVGFYHVSALSAIDDIASAYGLEVEAEIAVSADKVASRKVNLRAKRGSDNGKRFTYSKDLTSVKRTVSSDDVVTRLYGYGKGLEQTDSDGNATGGYTRKLTFRDVNGGKDYVEDADAAKLWGMLDANGNLLHAEGMADFPECEDASELLALTRAELDSRKEPQVSYECDVVALDAAGLGHEGVDIGDTVQIVDTVFSPHLRLSGRITKLEEDLLDGAGAIKATVGNVYETLTSKMAKERAATQKIWSQSSAWSSAASATPAYIEQVIKGLNSVMNAAGGYVYMEPGEGITVYDRPVDGSPTMAMQLTGAGFRIADSKRSNGEWDWRTFGTGSGFTADELSAGVIQGGSNHWDLETGDLLFKQGRIADAAGKTSWNLTTGEFSGTDISASGTFSTSSGSRKMALGDGKLKLLDGGTEVASIELSDLVLSLTSNNKISLISDYVLQLMSGAGLYITAPYAVITDPSTGSGVTAYTGTASIGGKSVKVINGMIVSIS